MPRCHEAEGAEKRFCVVLIRFKGCTVTKFRDTGVQSLQSTAFESVLLRCVAERIKKFEILMRRPRRGDTASNI